MLNRQRDHLGSSYHGSPRNLLLVAGSEGYAIDMGVIASQFTNVTVLRWTTPEFEGSLFELFTIRRGRPFRVSRIKIPFRTRRRYQWYASRLPLFVVNTLMTFILAIKARNAMGANGSGVSGLGIGWGGGLVTMLLRRFSLLADYAYYRVDWFEGRPNHNYDFLTVNIFFRILDRAISRSAHYVWNITDAVREAASRTHHFSCKNESILTPPINVHLKIEDGHRIRDRYLVYCGEVKPGCGLPLILEALQVMLSRDKTVKLKVLGRARLDYLTDLHRKFGEVFSSGACQYLGGFDLGDEDDRQRVNWIIGNAYAGIAIFPDGYRNTSNYVIPNRMLLYLANRTPVLINSDSAIAELLCSAGVAVSTLPAPESIAKSVLSLWETREYRSKLRSNIDTFIASFGAESDSASALRELTGPG